MDRLIGALATFCFAAQSIGCARTLNPGSQVVRFASVPSGATVHIDSRELKTPARANLDPGQNYSVKFSKPGYREEYVSVDRRISGAFWVGLFIWGPFELLSFVDGKVYEIKPSEVFVTMEEAPVVPEVEATPPQS